MASPLSYNAFSEQYIEQCFESWYSHGCPSSPARSLDILPIDEQGRKPSARTVADWMNERNWNFRKDELNAEVFRKSTENLIVKQVEMMQRQAQYGFDMQAKGIEYIKENGFDTAASAVNSISKGVEIERSSRGVSKFLIELVDKSDADIKEEIKKLSERISPDGEIIDMVETKEETDTKSDNEDTQITGD